MQVPDELIQKRRNELVSGVMEALALRVAEPSAASSARALLQRASEALGADAASLKSGLSFAAAIVRERIAARAVSVLEKTATAQKTHLPCQGPTEKQTPSRSETNAECTPLPLQSACEDALERLRLVSSTTKMFTDSSFSSGSDCKGGEVRRTPQTLQNETLSPVLKKLLKRLAVALFSQVANADEKSLTRAREFCLVGFRQIVSFFKNEKTFTSKGNLNMRGIEALLEIMQDGVIEATVTLRQQLAVSVPMENRSRAICCAQRLVVIDEVSNFYGNALCEVLQQY